MAWQTPVTDWSPGDQLLSDDVNRIEENTRYLHDDAIFSADRITAGELIGKVRGGTSAQAADTSLQLRDIAFGTDALTAGVTALQTGVFYFQYE